MRKLVNFKQYDEIFFFEYNVQIVEDVATAMLKSTAVAFKASSGFGWHGVLLIRIIHCPSHLYRNYILSAKSNLLFNFLQKKRKDYTIFFIAVMEALSHSPTSSIG